MSQTQTIATHQVTLDSLTSFKRRDTLAGSSTEQKTLVMMTKIDDLGHPITVFEVLTGPGLLKQEMITSVLTFAIEKYNEL